MERDKGSGCTWIHLAPDGSAGGWDEGPSIRWEAKAIEVTNAV